MQLAPQRAEHVRLMQVIGGGHHDGVEFVELEHFLEVGEHVGHVEPIGQRAGLGPIVVTQRHEARAAHLREDGDVRDLGDRACADDGDTHAILHAASGSLVTR
jgi:hypothetical protein